MRIAEQQIRIARGLAKRLLPVTLGIGVIISLISPVIYYTLRLNDLEHEARIYAENLAHQLEFVLSESPALWKYQTATYLQILDEFMPEKGLAVIRVLDEGGRPIPGYTHMVEPLDRWGPFRPHMGKASLLFERRPVGTVEVGVSQGSLLKQSLIIFLACTLVGFGLAAVAYYFPITVVTRLEGRLRESVEAAEHANTRIGALVKANRMLTVSLDMNETLRTIIHEAASISDSPKVRLLLLEEDGKALRLRVSEGLPPDATTGLAIPVGESFSGQVAATRAPLAVVDTRGDSRELYPEDAVRYGLVSYLGLPVQQGEQLFGVLAFHTNAPRTYSPEEIELLSAFAAQAAIAIENARLHAATIRRGEQLETIRAAGIEITRELELTAVLHLIAERVVELVGGGQGMIRLWDGDSQSLVQRTFTGSGLNQNSVPLRLGEGVAGTAAQRRQGMIVNDFRTSPYAIPHLLDGTNHTAVLAEPLLYGDRLVGVLSILREAGQQPFAEEDQQILAIFASQAAIAIENARLHETAVRHGAQMEALLSSLQTLTSGLDLREILDRILDEAIRISGAPHVKVLLFDKTSRVLRVGALRGLGMPPVDALPAGASLSLSGLVAQSGEPLFIADAQNDSRNLWRERDREFGIVTYLGLPIKKGEEVLGVLSFNNTFLYQYTPEEMILLTSFAAQAAIAIENARLYEEVTQHATTLETRVRERTTELARINLELTDALRQAEAGNRAKNDFLINMSHELRTPLNSVLGFAQLLQEQAKEALTDKQRRYLDNIYNSGHHLLTLVNEILDLDTVEGGRLTLDLTRVNAAEVIADALAATREPARQKNHSVLALIPSDLPAVSADPVRIRQIVGNLLSNAVKFTPAGGTITVAARRISNLENIAPGPQSQIANQKSQIRDFVEIVVADNGVGIRAEDLPRLFQTFAQLESPIVKSHGGAGIGLALAKKLVDLHGGTITAASPGAGQGSTFTVRMPVEQGE